MYEPQKHGINNRYWVLNGEKQDVVKKRYVIELSDLVALTQYVFTNTDIEEEIDPRLELLENIEQEPEGQYQLQLWNWLRSLALIEGFPQYPPPKIPTQRLSPGSARHDQGSSV